MRRRVSYGAWLLAVWIALWAGFTVANLVSGVVVVTVLLVLFPPRGDHGPGRARLLPAARLLCYFLWKLVEASVIVAWEVVTPRNRVREGIVAAPLRGVSEGVTTLVANAVSLTPGTLTIDVSRHPPVLYVHVLHLRDADAVRREVLHFEDLAARAVGAGTVHRSGETAVAAGPAPGEPR